MPERLTKVIETNDDDEDEDDDDDDDDGNDDDDDVRVNVSLPAGVNSAAQILCN